MYANIFYLHTWSNAPRTSGDTGGAWGVCVLEFADNASPTLAHKARTLFTCVCASRYITVCTV
jgi:hypothetical protein